MAKFHFVGFVVRRLNYTRFCVVRRLNYTRLSYAGSIIQDFVWYAGSVIQDLVCVGVIFVCVGVSPTQTKSCIII